MTRLTDPSSVAPEEALVRLKEGNRRFVECTRESPNALWRPGLAAGQRPFAVVLCCSDSRSPAELVFEQGLGDLFVIRVAGNVVAPSGIGSVEFAVARLGVRLVVVMGHTHCGAVQATFDALEGLGPSEAEHIKSITGRIAPHVQELAKLDVPKEERLLCGVRTNVRVSLDQLKHGSAMLESTGDSGRVAFRGALLHLETGEVEWLDGTGAN